MTYAEAMLPEFDKEMEVEPLGYPGGPTRDAAEKKGTASFPCHLS